MAILVCPLSRVPHVIQARQPMKVVSLLDPATPFPDAGKHGVSKHLKLSVHDIAEDEPGFIAPHQGVVRDLLDFVGRWDQSAPILFHCWAGISRSTASAFITACLHNPNTDEGEVAAALRAASPTASPNPRLIALADAELGRAGRMIKAVREIGLGFPAWPDIPEAKPFEIPARIGSKAA
jgi:predicted protein tyrosine phosphatase